MNSFMQCMGADSLHRRLKKIVGQVQDIDRMADEDVPCEDILSQINAAKSALHRRGLLAQNLWRSAAGAGAGRCAPLG
ncbi:metal-sensing transcriptional repressor [Paratractidigestivibacter sp.]|uniref:metal-sensing transcriptional repressor n=1 Tax=Paratractidigestivibacter sp. TaxID=2847316 RepID=UPI002ABDDEE2|nr:metal-sensing transcriptional repressor [Paratractidigestivibacter sp.]